MHATAADLEEAVAKVGGLEEAAAARTVYVVVVVAVAVALLLGETGPLFL